MGLDLVTPPPTYKFIASSLHQAARWLEPESADFDRRQLVGMASIIRGNSQKGNVQ